MQLGTVKFTLLSRGHLLMRQRLLYDTLLSLYSYSIPLSPHHPHGDDRRSLEPCHISVSHFTLHAPTLPSSLHGQFPPSVKHAPTSRAFFLPSILRETITPPISAPLRARKLYPLLPPSTRLLSVLAMFRFRDCVDDCVWYGVTCCDGRFTGYIIGIAPWMTVS